MHGPLNVECQTQVTMRCSLQICNIPIWKICAPSPSYLMWVIVWLTSEIRWWLCAREIQIIERRLSANIEVYLLSFCVFHYQPSNLWTRQYFLSFYNDASFTPVANSKGKFVISHFFWEELLMAWSGAASPSEAVSDSAAWGAPNLSLRPTYPRNWRSAVLLGYPVPRWNTTPCDPGQYILCPKVIIYVVCGENARLIARLWQG